MLGTASGWDLTRDLAQVISEPVLCISGLVEAARHQRLDPIRLESGDDFLELPDHFGSHNVDRRIVDGDTPISGRRPGQVNLRGCCRFDHSGHGILLRIC